MNKDLKELIKKSCILGLAYDTGLPEHIRIVLKCADDEGRQLTTKEMEEICIVSSVGTEPLIRLQDKAASIVADAKKQLLEEEPQLVKLGGALYPVHRAEACWRDCWHFLRIAIYAAAAQRESFLYSPGVEAMGTLYRSLKVPIASMQRALFFLRKKAVAVYAETASQNNAMLLDRCIQSLEDMMATSSFQAQSIDALRQ